MSHLQKPLKPTVVNIKEKLYGRLNMLRHYIENMEIDEYGPLDFTEAAYYNEVQFLEDLQHWIEGGQ